ncbi:hypothetical protein, partial [Phocaeicola sp.]|uniref:hypothetical protein n=1 Tax=Phocaeicola sp. TaxID=2773926 RepID=UPI003AB66478
KMTVERAKELQEKWEAKLKNNPDLKCDHPYGLEKEYYLGTHTGDYICPVCGEAFSLEEKRKTGL